MDSLDFVVLVDVNDQQIGIMEKLEAHQKGELHRAFSIFIFNSQNQLLLQQRSHTKYHSPLLWTNTCCSHPRPNENILEAANRRLFEEMGIEGLKLKNVDTLLYRSKMENGLIEHEFDYIFIGKSDDSPKFNIDEVEAYKYLSMDDIKELVRQNPADFTEWFKIILPKLPFYHH